jgi:hypothetical protein
MAKAITVDDGMFDWTEGNGSTPDLLKTSGKRRVIKSSDLHDHGLQSGNFEGYSQSDNKLSERTFELAQEMYARLSSEEKAATNVGVLAFNLFSRLKKNQPQAVPEHKHQRQLLHAQQPAAQPTQPLRSSNTGVDVTSVIAPNVKQRVEYTELGLKNLSSVAAAPTLEASIHYVGENGAYTYWIGNLHYCVYQQKKDAQKPDRIALVRDIRWSGYTVENMFPHIKNVKNAVIKLQIYKASANIEDKELLVDLNVNHLCIPVQLGVFDQYIFFIPEEQTNG